MTCWGKWNATWHLCYAVLLMSFCGWNTDWAITWGMRCSVMFIHVKTSSTEEGMIVFTRAPLCHHCTSLRRVTAQAQEPELIAAARVNACIGFIPARFWTVPEAALQRVYTAICHATKTVKTPFIIWISFKKKKKKKKKLFSFGTHAYRTERPIPKRFGTNTCTVSPLIYTIHFHCMRKQLCFPLKKSFTGENVVEQHRIDEEGRRLLFGRTTTLNTD